MSDFKKQTAKEGFQNANAKFMGYTAEPMTGEKEGRQWRKAKLSFQIEGKQDPNKFVIWTPLNSEKTKYKSDEELKQFNNYNIVWVEKERNYEGREWVEKQIVIIKDPETNQNKNFNQTTKPVNKIIADEAFQQALVDYLNTVRPIIKEKPEEEKNLMVGTRMIGSILVKTHPELFKELLKICDEAIHNFKP